MVGESAPLISGDLAHVFRDAVKLNPKPSLVALYVSTFLRHSLECVLSV